MPLTLQFLGAAQTVTGSKYLIAASGKNYLVDCGLFQGLKHLRLKNRDPFAVSPKEIAAVLLTHAHIDHSGYLPLLVKNGFKNKIYCTPPTLDLCKILLPDSGYLQEEDAAYAERHGFSKHHPALPLYTEKDAEAALHFFETRPWNEKTPLSGDVAFDFQRAGHILGAASIRFFAGGKTITFSGDLGRQNHFVMPPPVALTHADYLVVESTYGDHRHPAEDPHDTLKKIIQETVSKKGVVLIPAFAVGRSQALLFILSRLKREKAIPDIPVYLNSPMATEATHVFLNFFRETLLSREESQELTRVARFVTSIDESKMLNGLKGPAVVISASGMATGGRVLHHLKYLGPDPNNTIVFAGFQPPGTRGDALLKGAKTTKIHGEEVPIRARVELVDTLSSHADQEELMIWLKKFAKPPRMTFITHGELPAAEVLQEKIEKELGWNCTIPDHLEKFTL